LPKAIWVKRSETFYPLLGEVVLTCCSRTIFLGPHIIKTTWNIFRVSSKVIISTFNLRDMLAKSTKCDALFFRGILHLVRWMSMTKTETSHNHTLMYGKLTLLNEK